MLSQTKRQIPALKYESVRIKRIVVYRRVGSRRDVFDARLGAQTRVLRVGPLRKRRSTIESFWSLAIVSSCAA
jgi:hypothetical protein